MRQRKGQSPPPSRLNETRTQLCNPKGAPTVRFPLLNTRVALAVLTYVPVGFDINIHPVSPERDRRWDTGSQYGAHQPIGVDTPWQLYGVMSTTPPVLPAGYFDPCGNHLIPTRFHPSQLPECYGGFGAGGGADQVFTVSPNDVYAYGGIGPMYEDPGGFLRYDTNPGDPIHLTTNISAASHQVSFQHLSQEVCRYSVRKTHWY